MEPSTTEARIRELERVRRKITLWRSGSAAVIALTMVGCIWLLWSDARALIDQGPKQQIFVDTLQARMNENVFPRLQEVASRQLTEMQPIVQKEFMALNSRVPDVTQASLKQLDELQKSLPERGSKVLDDTFETAFRAKEPEIKKMFPDATEEQVKTLFTNLGNVVSVRSGHLAGELLQPHVSEMQKIHQNLQAIAESKDWQGASTNDWEMGLAVLDVVRDDLKDLTIPKAKDTGVTKKGAAAVAKNGGPK